jgi:murein L,D-transpeptidase YafK
MLKRFALIAGVTLALAACQENASTFDRSGKHLTPIPAATVALMSSKAMTKADPIVIRSFKKEAEMEIWKRTSSGRYALLKTFPICRWSGQLGPKIKEGDRQAPEGFYTITQGQMNPNSAYFLSFDTGYPNAFDRAHGRTGSALMVHGSCSSRGCFAMTDEAIAEVYAIARDSFFGGQRTFQFQSYPFRMTAENMAKHRLDQHAEFWQNLKEGYDYFEVTGAEPKVAVCGKRYVFGDGSCSPEVPAAVAQKRARDDQQVAALVSRGTPAVKVVYDDGGQHPSFQSMFARGRDLGDVSRPEAIAAGPREIIMNGASEEAPRTALAFKQPAPAEAKTTARGPAQVQPQSVATAAAPAPQQDKPFYQRILGKIAGAE